MSGIEPETRDFLKRIMQTVSMGMLFLLVHMTVGIYFNWAFFEEEIHTGNIAYYFFLIVSLTALIYYYYRMWKGKI